MTRSMQQAIDETNRRRDIQQAYNRKHGITPASIQKAVAGTFDFGAKPAPALPAQVAEAPAVYESLEDVDADIRRLEKQMHQAARELDFERAADLRDQIKSLQQAIVLGT
jgi:excinuclease ABC subunit B